MPWRCSCVGACPAPPPQAAPKDPQQRVDQSLPTSPSCWQVKSHPLMRLLRSMKLHLLLLCSQTPRVLWMPHPFEMQSPMTRCPPPEQREHPLQKVHA